MRKRVLFVAENVTLAQVVRLVTLARALPQAWYEVHFACSEFPGFVFDGLPFERHHLDTLDAAQAMRALEAGKRLYEKRTLSRYVEAELALLERVQPDLVVGDFRLSLSTSAEKFGVPCAVLINAYWSPFAERDAWPVPDHPIIGLVGEEMAARYFPVAMPRVFKHFAAPVNAVRKKYGLAPVGSLQETLCHGDTTLYPDDPWLSPVLGAPSTHVFLGPVLWEPEVPMPDLSFAEPERPLVYVTLGSSGRVDLLPTVVEALGGLPVNAAVATADRAELRDLPANVHAAAFLPGSELARRARLVISNGGSTTGYQALREGTPVIGVPTNFDQFLATQAICKRGAGIEVKARNLTVEGLRSAITSSLDNEALRAAAQEVGRRFAQRDSRYAFRTWLQSEDGRRRLSACS